MDTLVNPVFIQVVEAKIDMEHVYRAGIAAHVASFSPHPFAVIFHCFGER